MNRRGGLAQISLYGTIVTRQFPYKGPEGLQLASTLWPKTLGITHVS